MGGLILIHLFQSPKKVNLVAALVRGMRVEDALLQLQVTIKRASKTVYQVILNEVFVFYQLEKIKFGFFAGGTCDKTSIITTEAIFLNPPISSVLPLKEIKK